MLKGAYRIGSANEAISLFQLCGQAATNLRHYEAESSKNREAWAPVSRIPPDKGSRLKSSSPSAGSGEIGRCSLMLTFLMQIPGIE